MSEELKTPAEAKQLIVDLYGCRCSRFDDLDYIKEVIHKVCCRIHTDIVEECYHKFSPIGISAAAIITTSHLSIHTWPEYGYAAVDIFSCKEEIPGEICQVLSELFEAEDTKTRLITRSLGRKREGIRGQNVKI